MTYEQQFLDALKSIFIGAKVEGESGYINLMKIKASYFEKGVFPQLMKDIDAACKPFEKGFREELFDKLHDFFQHYFSESGSIYFRATAQHHNIYEKVYTDDRDVMLFWKTHMLYYVKTDRLFNSMEVEVDGESFYFDVSEMELKRANEKRELTYTFKSFKDGKVTLTVVYSERGRKTKVDEIVKAVKDKGMSLDEETLEKAFRVFEKQSEVDYFINKNAKAFLQEQFDLWMYQYIFKGESVFNETRLKQLQAIKEIAFKIIDFIAQFEDELVKVWNKPKFVLNSNYIITLDKITDDALFKKILKHKGMKDQVAEWQKLGMVDKEFKLDLILEKNLLKEPANPQYQFLPLDTKYFKDIELDILGLFDDLDASLDGWLIRSENYQALNTFLPKYHSKIKTIYIDPPYNTAASEIIYVNKYKHSSWVSLMMDRLELGRQMLDPKKGFLCCTIDDVEQSTLNQLIDTVFGDVVGTVGIRIKPSGRPIPNGFAISHEYAIFARVNPSYPVARLEHSKEQKDRYREKDEKGPFFWEMLRKAGSNSNRENRPTMYFPFFLNTKTGIIRLPEMEFDEGKQYYDIKEVLKANEIEVYPTKDDGSEGVWYFGYEKAEAIASELKAEPQDNQYRIYYRRRPNEGVQPTTLWYESKYSATEHGTALLKNLFGEQETFTYPKSIHAVLDCLSVTGALEEIDGIYLDYFGGSGTTAHAVVNLNRADGGKRKYILVEMGDHFDAVMVPRVKKVAFSDKWKNGKAQNGQGISHFVKYFELEQYEDALKRARFEDVDTPLFIGADAYSSYIFLRDLKMLEAVKVNKKQNQVEVSLNRLYDGIDLAETLSCLKGKWIKRITKDTVEFQDGTTASLSRPEWDDVKPLIWW